MKLTDSEGNLTLSAYLDKLDKASWNIINELSQLYDSYQALVNYQLRKPYTEQTMV